MANADESTPKLRKVERPVETAAIFLMAIAVLYLGQGILVPMVMAILVAFAISPLVALLRHLGLAHPAAVAVSVLLVLGLAAGVSYVAASQLFNLAADLPRYQATIGEKLRGLQNFGGGGLFERLASAVEAVGRQVTPAESPANGEAPIPVVVTNEPPSPLGDISGLLGSLLGPLATAAIVIVFSVFLLIERSDLRDRFIKLVSGGNLRTSTKAMNEAGERVSRYLLTQFTVNTCWGTAFAVGLLLLGVPNAVLWGLFAVILRYIPYVGTLIAAAAPALLAVAVDPGWTMLAGVVGLYLGLELFTGNFVEPRLYGSTTGLSALAVLVAAIFWATLWGPIGLILATPITVCLVVMGRYVPRLAFLETMLGSEPVLRPEERLYQRLLAGNVEEAVELAEHALKDDSTTGFFDRIALPALRLAEADLRRDATDLVRRRTVVDTLSDVIEDVREIDAGADADGEAEAVRVLAIGGKTELDGAAATMLTESLRLSGIGASALPPIAVNRQSIGQLDTGGIEVACLCYLDNNPRPYVRYIALRLKRNAPGLRIVACLFGRDASLLDTDPASLNADAIVGSIHDATARVLALTSGEEDDTASAEGDAELVRALRRAAGAGGWLDAMCVGMAEEFGVTLAMATFIDGGEIAADERGGRIGRPAQALAARVVERQAPLVIEDIATDKDFADDAFLIENGFAFYAGVPLATRAGVVVGALGLFDREAGKFSPSALDRLQKQAATLMREGERRLRRSARPSLARQPA